MRYWCLFLHLVAVLGAHALTPEDAVKHCELNYKELYSRIDDDLRHWQKDGISQELMDKSLVSFTSTKLGQKAIGVLFEAGQPFILSNMSVIYKLGHHAGLITAHLRLLHALGRRFGALIPDVEFIIGTADSPEFRLDKVPAGQVPMPILRFCKSKYHADILVPDIHFQMRAFNETLLGKVEDINRQYTWAAKKEALFGRFSQYKRIIHEGLPDLYRNGSGGSNICRVADYQLLFCDVRVHFMDWAAAAARQREKQGQAAGEAAARLREKQGQVGLDVARQPRVKMMQHAGYKYLLHLDGQTCSSRLEQLLVMGSLVFKEESGYHAFFHHLMKPNEHYVPVWKERPEDVLEALAWAKDHDVEAQQMAQRAQKLASDYLGSEALTCYWYMLLVRLSKLLKYKPGRRHRQYDFAMPVVDYLRSDDGRTWIKKYGLSKMELP